MSDFKQYQRTAIAEMRPYVDGEKLPKNVSISQTELDNGSPKYGDMIARNPENHNDQWLVTANYFSKNFCAVGEGVYQAILSATPQTSFQLPDFATDPDDSDEGASLWDLGFKRGWNSCLEVVTGAMQSAERPPVLDVSALVEALEIARDTLDNVRGNINPVRGDVDELEEDVSVAYSTALSALATYRNGGEL